VRRQTLSPIELIVVDNQSTDDTIEIARRHADLVETFGPERSAQRNRGLALATGDLIVFLDSDQQLLPTVLEEAVKAFAARPDIGALVIPEVSFGVGYLAKCRALEKRLYLGDTRVEAARVFARSALDQVGGYDENLVAGEDWELPDRVERAGFGLARVRAEVLHDEGRIELGTQFRKKRYYGRSLAAYYAGTAHTRPVSRMSLVTQPRKLLADAWHVPGLVALKLVEALGIFMGMRDGRKSPGR
jgi:glycosyltransferase involved in cell wall biosynthesis